MNKHINRLVFFIGWLLSPLTFWNDALINIPLSYLLASFIYRFLQADFLLLVLCAYWLSNIAGIAMMYLSGKSMMGGKPYSLKEVMKVAMTMAVYSAILALLYRSGILKPAQQVIPGF